MANQSNDVRAPGQQEYVRCNSCRAAISSLVSRCQYCGQLTVGTERPVSKLEMDTQRRERIAEHRPRNQCKMCGKAVAPNTPLCMKCEAADRNKRRLLVLLVIFATLTIFWLFS